MSVSATDHRRHDPAGILWALTAVGWAAMLALVLVPGGMLGMPAMAAQGLAAGRTAPALTLAAFTGGWLVMVAAMMLPTTVPFGRAFGVVAARQGGAGTQIVFFCAYLAVWLAFGGVGLAAAAAVGHLTRGAAPDLVLAGALALAGAFQFAPLKRRCLTLCRDPRAFLFAHYRRGRGAAWSIGVRHALSCVGCCWALMLVMFATGVGGLVWMLGLTAVMVAEKLAPWGRRIAAPVGIALLVAAALFAVIGFRGTGGAPPPMPMG